MQVTVFITVYIEIMIFKGYVTPLGSVTSTAEFGFENFFFKLISLRHCAYLLQLFSQ